MLLRIFGTSSPVSIIQADTTFAERPLGPVIEPAILYLTPYFVMSICSASPVRNDRKSFASISQLPWSYPSDRKNVAL